MKSRERNMLIILGVVGVAAGSFYFLTSGDEEPEEASAPTPGSSTPAVATSPQETEGQEAEEEAEEALDFLGGRDPFEPLVVEVGGDTGGTTTDDTATGETTTGETTTGDTTGETTTGETTTGDTTGETTTGETTTGDTTAGDTTTGGTSSGGTSSEGGAVEVSLTGRPVTLVSIRGSEGVAQVEVAGQSFSVGEGQRFSRHFELVSVSRNCARFLFGDESFTLCEEAPPR